MTQVAVDIRGLKTLFDRLRAEEVGEGALTGVRGTEDEDAARGGGDLPKELGPRVRDSVLRHN